jgi:hypothetical protein
MTSANCNSACKGRQQRLQAQQHAQVNGFSKPSRCVISCSAVRRSFAAILFDSCEPASVFKYLGTQFSVPTVHRPCCPCAIASRAVRHTFPVGSASTETNTRASTAGTQAPPATAMASIHGAETGAVSTQRQSGITGMGLHLVPLQTRRKSLEDAARWLRRRGNDDN